jgi:hypothetical protein
MSKAGNRAITFLIAVVASMTVFIIAAGAGEWLQGGNVSDNGVPFYAYSGVAYAAGIIVYAAFFILLRLLITRYIYKSLAMGIYLAVNLFFFVSFLVLQAFAVNLHL